MKPTQTLNLFLVVAMGTAKYAALFSLGITLAMALAFVFGLLPIAHLVMVFLWEWLWRTVLLLAGLWTVGMVVESVR